MNTVEQTKDDMLARQAKALRLIKAMVCGEQFPKWADQFATTKSRYSIADICDMGLGNTALSQRQSEEPQGGDTGSQLAEPLA